MTWLRLVSLQDFPESGVLETAIEGADLLVWRLQDGGFGAINAYCPHMQSYIPNGLAPGVSLSALLQNSELVCPFHGWRYNHTGHCTLIPPGQATPSKVGRGEALTHAWPVRTRDGWLEIEI